MVHVKNLDDMKFNAKNYSWNSRLDAFSVTHQFGKLIIFNDMTVIVNKKCFYYSSGRKTDLLAKYESEL